MTRERNYLLLSFLCVNLVLGCPALLPKANGVFFVESFTTDGNRLSFVSNPAICSSVPGQDNQDGTILDLDTSLVWQKCHAGQTNFTTCSGGTNQITDWATAITYCQNLNLAEKTWRLPNANELRSLLDFYRIYGKPAFDPIFFPNTAVNTPPSIVRNYWTSTTGTLNSPTAFVVNFGDAGGGPDAKNNVSDNYTRCVSDF